MILYILKFATRQHPRDKSNGAYFEIKKGRNILSATKLNPANEH